MSLDTQILKQLFVSLISKNLHTKEQRHQVCIHQEYPHMHNIVINDFQCKWDTKGHSLHRGTNAWPLCVDCCILRAPSGLHTQWTLSEYPEWVEWCINRHSEYKWWMTGQLVQIVVPLAPNNMLHDPPPLLRCLDGSGALHCDGST